MKCLQVWELIMISISFLSRTPHETIEFVENSTSDVFIAGADIHLPGVVAGITTKPVIGVPVNTANPSMVLIPYYQLFKCHLG